MMKNLWVKKNMHNYQQCNKLYEKPTIATIANGITKKPKRFRSAFTTEQVNYLEREYKKFPYVAMDHRTEIAIALNIPERAVKIWFQNRRMKEKKESITKDFCDDQTSQQPVEFGKNRLNNVITMRSTNDQSVNSLPLLTTDVNDTSKSIGNNKFVHVDAYNPMSKDHVLPKYNEITNQNKLREKQLTFVKCRGLANDPRSSSHANINLCRKYKRDNNLQSASSHVGAKETEKIQNKIPSKHKMVPEQLSATKPILLQPEQQTSARHYISGYVPVVPTFYPQPFVSPSGVLWKPVNVMPVMSGPSHTIPTKDFNVSGTPEHNSTPKMCNCDCHLKSFPISMGHQNAPSPQYVFTALPLKRPSTMF